MRKSEQGMEESMEDARSLSIVHRPSTIDRPSSTLDNHRSTTFLRICCMSAEARIKELNLELPPAPKPAGVYKPCVQVGNLLYVSGHGPIQSDGSLMTGRVGADMNEEQAKAAARQTGLTILATLRTHLGSLDRVVRTIKTLGMVNSVPDYKRHPIVINGFSELMREVFGEDGVGARSAVGMGSLPSNIPVEVEVIFEIRD
jgi:enamine deaminase RidA (YjgF/YER057c/UK114 family)